MASPSMSIESANSAVECARTPATLSVRNIAALIQRTTSSTRRCSPGTSRPSQQSSMWMRRPSRPPPRKLAAALGGSRCCGGSLGLVAGLRAADLGQGGFLQRLADVVADPLGVPPLERRDRRAVEEHLVVEVIADCEPGRARARDLLALLDRVAHFHGDAR